MSLFQLGDFTLHSGQHSSFKIDCDFLTDASIEALANIIGTSLYFNKVISVPTGGDRFAKALQKYAISNALLTLVADDVLTTGNSMMEVISQIPLCAGVVMFSRIPRIEMPKNVTALFYMEIY